MSKVVDLNASLSTIESGIICIQAKLSGNDFELDVPLAKSFIELAEKKCKGIPRPFLFDLRDIDGIMTIEAGRLLAKSEILKYLRIAHAFIVNSLSVRLMVNFYLRVYSPGCPGKIFDQEGEAINWLRKFK